MAEASTFPSPITLNYATAGRTGGVPWWVWTLVIFAFAIRFGAALLRPVTDASLAALPDQREYVQAATFLHSGMGMFFIDDTFGDALKAYRMPGYPALVAVCRHAGRNLLIVQTVQAAMDASCVLAVFLIGQRAGSLAIGTSAAVAVTVNPYLIYFSTLILSETLFTATLAWGVFALLSRVRPAQYAGVLLLLASVYVRPSAVGLGVVSAGATFFTGPTLARRFGNGFAGTVVAALVMVGALSPWAYRNKVVTGSNVWLTTNDGFSAYDAFNPRANGSSDQAWFRAKMKQEAQDEADRLEAAQEKTNDQTIKTTLPDGSIRSETTHHDWMPIRIHDEVSRSRRLSAMAWDYAKSHPLRDIELAFAKLGRFWSPVPLSADFGGRWLYVAVGGAYCIPLFVFAAIGVFRGGLGKRMTLTLLLPALYFTAVHSLAVGSLRYRVPCDVPLAVLAAAGVMSLVRPKAAA